MVKTCEDCGCPLKKTTHDRDWCPNCFKIVGEESGDEEGERNYIG